MKSPMMKKVFIVIGIVSVVVAVLLILVLLNVSRVILEAEGKALNSSVGAWTRIQEFANVRGKASYIEEADKTLELLNNDLMIWREDAQLSGLDLGRFDKIRKTAYETTDKNIKGGLNPLAYLDDK